jgi:hypothetical protein
MQVCMITHNTMQGNNRTSLAQYARAINRLVQVLLVSTCSGGGGGWGNTSIPVHYCTLHLDS